MDSSVDLTQPRNEPMMLDQETVPKLKHKEENERAQAHARTHRPAHARTHTLHVSYLNC